MGLICLLLTVYLLVIFARIVLSWFPIAPGGPMEAVNRVLYGLTEPLLGPLRRTIPPVRMGTMGLDLSPIVVTVAIFFLQSLLC